MASNNFHGRVALITGAGSGLGYTHAVKLAHLGAKVFIQDLRGAHGASPEEKTAQEVAAELISAGFNDVAYQQGSVGDEKYCEDLVRNTVERFGRIDILINNAGKPAADTAQDATTETLLESLKINLLGSFWTMRTALGYMRNQNYGRIVNTASGTAAFGSPNMFSYVTAKGGVLSMTRAAALDNHDKDIKINAFCPIAFTVMGREYFSSRKGLDLSTLSPEFASPLALYLAHEKCAFTGETFSAGAGKWSNIFEAKTDGPNAISKDLDDVFTSIDQIADRNLFTVPLNAQAQYDK